MGASNDVEMIDACELVSKKAPEKNHFQLYDSRICCTSPDGASPRQYGALVSPAAHGAVQQACLNLLPSGSWNSSPRSSLERSQTSISCFGPPALLDDGSFERRRASESEAACCSHAEGPWKDIPDDILKRVLDFMPASYIRVIRRVCRGWCDAAARFITRVKPEQFNAALLLCRFPHLQALHLSHCSMAMVTRSKNALQLCSLLSDADLEQLPGLVELRSLRVLSLQRCMSLTGNPEGPFRHLAALTQLTALDVSFCTNLQERAMDVILRLPNLEALYMTGCRNMTDMALGCLVEARPDLRELEFGASASITDTGLAHLAKLRSLEKLSMTRCPNVSDEGLMHLLGLPRLRTVIISCCANITEEGVRLVAAHQTLKVVTAAVLPTRRLTSWQASAYPALDMRLLEY